MPILDFKCRCGFTKEVLMFTSDKEPNCPKCGERMLRQFSPQGQKFKLVYDNKTDMCDWSGNTSRYWDDVKKQEEGKVRPVAVTENIS